MFYVSCQLANAPWDNVQPTGCSLEEKVVISLILFENDNYIFEALVSFSGHTLFPIAIPLRNATMEDI